MFSRLGSLFSSQPLACIRLSGENNPGLNRKKHEMAYRWELCAEERERIMGEEGCSVLDHSILRAFENI